MIWMLLLYKVLFVTYLNLDATVQVSSFDNTFVPKHKQLHKNYSFFKSTSQKPKRLASYASLSDSNRLSLLSVSSSITPLYLWKAEEDGIYSPFAEYAWSKLEEHNFIQSTTTKTCYEVDNASSPTPLKKTSSDSNTTSTESIATSQVHIHVKSSQLTSSSDNERKQDDDESPLKTWNALRYGRFALLETKDNGDYSKGKEIRKRSFNHAKGGNFVTFNAIHVLNLVLFPNLSSALSPPLPVLGIDLVSLPGNKHLIAIDFQPTLDAADNKDTSTFLPQQYKLLESKLKSIHDKYVLQKRDVIPWGGDIPPNAQRFFSPYALWTRLGGPTTSTDDCIHIIQTDIFQAFCAYFDLYLDLLIQVQNDLSSTVDKKEENIQEISISSAVLGQKDYLNYRMENDPARPMLNRLYGKDWAEELIETVLFPSI